MSGRASWIGALAVIGSVACGAGGGAPRTTSSVVAEMEQVRETPAAREGSSRAPQMFQHAEELRARALEAEKSGDDTAAGLYAERALGAYQRALVLARLARADDDLGRATKDLAEAGDQAKKLAQSRADVERDAEELEKKVIVAREMLLPAPSGHADAQREAARRVAARTLALQARLLCGSAKLLSSTLHGLDTAERELVELEKKLDGASGSTPVDAAARARAACLGLLTRARRAEGGASSAAATQADALLAELSAAGGWDPSRDERGVVLVLRNLFSGSALTSEGKTKLQELARVAAAHPGFAIQIVVHDSAPPSAAEVAANAARGERVQATLVAGGVPVPKVQVEMAGARAPLLDARDARQRARNARVEIVFVSASS